MSFEPLIADLKNGKREAQRELFDRLSERLFVLCERYMRNGQDAEERMQNGFCNFFRNIHTFNYESDAALHSCMTRIMTNECLAHLRLKSKLYAISEPEAEDIVYNEDALDALSLAEIHKLILELPDGYRTVFNLYAIEGLTHREIAGLLGISSGTSKSQLAKAKKMLQNKLELKGIQYGQQSK